MGAIQDATGQAALAKANQGLAAYGLALSAFAQLNVNLPDDDAARVKQLAQAKAFTGVAGSFGEYARGESMLQIAQGVEEGHVDAQPGMMVGMMMGAAPGGAATLGAPGPCRRAAATPAGARFCASCGAALPARARFCPACGTAVTTAVAPPAPPAPRRTTRTARTRRPGHAGSTVAWRASGTGLLGGIGRELVPATCATAVTTAPRTEIPVSCDNPQDWAPIVSEVQASGFEISMTPRAITELVAIAVPAVFAADATGNYQGLHTFFADDVVAELHRYPDGYGNWSPGPPPSTWWACRPCTPPARWSCASGCGSPPSRQRRAGTGPGPRSAPGAAPDPTVFGAFWDISQGQSVTLSRPTCPQCGAPVEMGSLRCRYCGGDVRMATQVPLLVTRVQRY